MSENEDARQNAVLGRLVDGFATVSISIGRIETLITERTRGLPALVEKVTDNRERIIIIETAKETTDKGLRNIKLFLALFISLATLGTLYATLIEKVIQ